MDSGLPCRKRLNAFSRSIQMKRGHMVWHFENIHKTLSEDEIVVVGAGVKMRDLQEAGVGQYVVRLANNFFTARRNLLPEYWSFLRRTDPPARAQVQRKNTCCNPA